MIVVIRGEFTIDSSTPTLKANFSEHPIPATTIQNIMSLTLFLHILESALRVIQFHSFVLHFLFRESDIARSFKFILKVGVEGSIVNAPLV
jgi:hypothetical protein